MFQQQHPDQQKLHHHEAECPELLCVLYRQADPVLPAHGQSQQGRQFLGVRDLARARDEFRYHQKHGLMTHPYGILHRQNHLPLLD